jgi:CRISPR-associated protein Cas2
MWASLPQSVAVLTSLSTKSDGCFSLIISPMTNRQLYLEAYDISCNRRLRKALYVLRSYASGGQKSVFECFLTPAEQEQLLEEIGRVIDPDEDRFILLRLAGAKHIRTLGKAVLPQDGSFFYVG